MKKKLITALMALAFVGSTYMIGYEAHTWGVQMNWWQTTTFLWTILASIGLFMWVMFYTVEC